MGGGGDGMLVHRRVTPSIVHLGGERSPAQEHNTMSTGKALTRTAQSRGEQILTMRLT